MIYSYFSLVHVQHVSRVLWPYCCSRNHPFRNIGIRMYPTEVGGGHELVIYNLELIIKRVEGNINDGNNVF